jgi:hypothetical protein
VKCNQDHKKITANAMAGMRVLCGVCGKILQFAGDKK